MHCTYSNPANVLYSLFEPQEVALMLIKIFVVILLFIIIGSLLSALFYLVRDSGDSNRTVKALTIRIALSLFAFIILMAGYFSGLIQPHGITP